MRRWWIIGVLGGVLLALLVMFIILMVAIGSNRQRSPEPKSDSTTTSTNTLPEKTKAELGSKVSYDRKRRCCRRGDELFNAAEASPLGGLTAALRAKLVA